jgi:glycosyltransferase involved in cell wall biosynthesis
MIRVLRIANRLNMGGPTYNIAYLTRYLGEGFETLLVSGNTDETEENFAYIVEELGIQPRYIEGMYRELHPWRDRKAFAEIRSIIREYKPHIVHTHAAKAGALGRMAAWLEGVPIIVHTFHGHVLHSYFGPGKTRIFLEIERFLAKRSTRIIALSQIQKDELSLQFKVAPPEKFTVVPLGFDLQKYTLNKEEKRQAYRSRFGIKDDEITIGIIGRLVPVKHHAFFLDVLKEVLNSTNRKVRGLIIGDGEERVNIEEMARDRGIAFSTEKDEKHQHPLIFTSWERDVDMALAGLDIVALTSLNEGTPVSLIEASAAGKPVVTTDVGGVRDVLMDGVNAFIVHKDDNALFTKRLMQLVEDSDLREKMGKAGSEQTLQQFSYTRLCKDVRELYIELLNEKGIREIPG